MTSPILPKCYDCKNYQQFHGDRIPNCKVYTYVLEGVWGNGEDCQGFAEKPAEFTQVCPVSGKEFKTKYDSPAVHPDVIKGLRKCKDCPDSEIIFDWYLDKDEKEFWQITCVDCDESMKSATPKGLHGKWKLTG